MDSEKKGSKKGESHPSFSLKPPSFHQNSSFHACALDGPRLLETRAMTQNRFRPPGCHTPRSRFYVDRSGEQLKKKKEKEKGHLISQKQKKPSCSPSF